VYSSTKGRIRFLDLARLSKEAIIGLMKKSRCSTKDFTKAVFGLFEPRTQATIAKDIGFDPKKQLQDSMSSQVGETGAAYSFMLLLAVTP
jgi:3-hydroxy-3-methylglutaryl CoA synthase